MSRVALLYVSVIGATLGCADSQNDPSLFDVADVAKPLVPGRSDLTVHDTLWGWTSIGVATGGPTICDPEIPPIDPSQCDNEEESPPPESLPDSQLFGLNPWNCIGHTEYPHKSGVDVSVHAWSECDVSQPIIRAETALQKWTLVWWITHDSPPMKALTNRSLVDVNARSDCSNGTWRGMSGHSIQGLDGHHYGVLTANRNQVQC